MTSLSLVEVLTRRREDEIPPDVQSALERTKAYCAWQKRKQAEARGKTVIPQEGEK